MCTSVSPTGESSAAEEEEEEEDEADKGLDGEKEMIIEIDQVAKKPVREIDSDEVNCSVYKFTQDNFSIDLSIVLFFLPLLCV